MGIRGHASRLLLRAESGCSQHTCEDLLQARILVVSSDANGKAVRMTTHID